MVVHGALAGAEIAIVTVRKTRIDELVSEGRGGAKALKRLRDDPENMFATAQTGISSIAAAAGAFGGVSLAKDLEPSLALLPYLGGSAPQLAFVLVVGFIAYLSLVVGELVPKSLALRSDERYALLIARPLLAASFVARPIVWFLTVSSNIVLRLFGDRTTFMESRLSPGEIQQLVDEATEAGSVDPAAGEIASRAIDFAGLLASHVMVPRHKVVGIPRSGTPEEIKRIVIEHGKTRLPVYEERIDDVVGYVTVRDLITLFLEQNLLVLEDTIRPAFKVQEDMRAVDLLAEMRKRRVQLAIVVDETGTMSGIITIEDLVEELVGEIASEHEALEPSPIQREASGAFLVRGDVPLRDLNREADLALPEADTWSTVAGLCLELAGRIPKAGESFASPDGTALEIVAASPRQVKRVRVTPKA